MARVHDVIASIAPKDSIARYESLGVDCVHGHAEIHDPHCVFVDGVGYKTKNILIASGAEPVALPIPGLDDDDCLTSRNLWSIQELPGRLVVVGGGPIGCELAQAFNRLGSDVTLVETEDRLLPREDKEVGTLMADIFGREGIRVLTGYRPDKCVGKRLSVTGSISVEELNFDRILIAAGRRPRTTGLGIEKLGIGTEPNGTLVVDRYLRTAVDSSIRGRRCGRAVSVHPYGGTSGMDRRSQRFGEALLAVCVRRIGGALGNLHGSRGRARGIVRRAGASPGPGYRCDSL